MQRHTMTEIVTEMQNIIKDRNVNSCKQMSIDTKNLQFLHIRNINKSYKGCPWTHRTHRRIKIGVCISSRKHAYIILTPLNPTFI